MAKLPGDPRAVQYIASDGQTEFDYDFLIYTNSEILVSKNNTILELGTDYTVAGAEVESGGTVILNTGTALDDVITLTGDSYVEPETSFIPGGAIIAEELTNTIDKIDNLVSELVTDTKRYVKQKVYDPNIDLSFPLPDSKKCIKWSETEDSLINSTYDPDEIPDKTQADVDKCDADVVLCDQAVLDCQTEVVNCEDQVTLASGFADNASDSADAAADSAEEAAASAASIDLTDLHSDILPVNNTYNCGDSTHRWQQVNTYALTASGIITSKLCRPSSNGNRDIGQTSLRWRDGYINNVICSTINGGEVPTPVKYAKFGNKEDNGVSGGGNIGSALTWHQRPVNTVYYNDITGASLDTNIITLPIGVYDFELWAQSYGTASTLLGLHDGTNPIWYQNLGYMGTGGQWTGTVSGRITLAAITAFTIRSYAGLSKANAYGNPISFGLIETYLTFTIGKIS